MPGVAAPEFVAPAVCWVPPRVASGGADAVDLAAQAGLVLDPWQAWAVEQALGERADGTSAAFEVGIVVGRQNGKGSILEALALAWLFLAEEELILWSAHEFKTAAEAFRRMRILLQGAPDLWRLVGRVTTANGDEAIELTTGQRLKFVARSAASGIGFTGDKIILDEARYLDADEIAAMVPTLATRPDPQIVYTSNAGRGDSHVLRAVRRRAMAGGDLSLCWLEWCAPEGADLDDRDAWRAANPGFGVRISEEFIDRERRAMASVPERFGRERLGWWDPPEEPDSAPISVEAWRGRLDPGSAVVEGRAVVFSAEIAMSRGSGSIAVAGRRADGSAHVGLVEHRAGTDWMLPRLVELAAAHSLHSIRRGKVVCAGIVLDPTSPAGTLVDALRAAGLEPVLLTAREVAAGCGGLQDAVRDGTVWHRGQPALETAIAGAAKRDLGDGGWAWGRRRSAAGGADITPVVAVTNAWWGLTQVNADYDVMASFY